MKTMSRALAYGNVALVKYWGKRSLRGNVPATPSVSIALDVLKTETTVSASEEDKFILNHVSRNSGSRRRVFDAVDLWRNEGSLRGYFAIDSVNSFPAGTGLASSASGFAALTMALDAMTGSPVGRDELIRRTRMGSGSAARSITGGLSILPTGDNPLARMLVPPGEIMWAVVIAITNSSEKPVSSREGMIRTAVTSPYYPAWIEQAVIDYKEILGAIEDDDLTRVGEITERNCLGMHACMMAARPPLLYWNAATVDVMRAVEGWRKGGIEAYFTIDAGSQVFILCRREDAGRLAVLAREVDGVREILIGYPAPGAKVIECR